MPKLSIIVPVYNKAPYLKDTVCALETQTFCDFELILVDDGSTDGSAEISDELAGNSKHIHVIHQKNEGVSSARNRGLAAATGEWVWFVDADDLPDMEFAMEAMRQSERLPFDVFCGNFNKLSGSDVIPVRNPCHGLLSKTALIDSFVALQPETGYYGYLWNKIIRRELILAHSIRFQRGLALAEDLDFMVSVYQHATDVFISPCTAMYYRTDAENASREKRIDYKAQFRIQIHIQDWFRSVNKDIEYRTFLNRNITKYAAYILFYDHEDGKDLSEGYAFLRSRPEVMACIDPRCMTGFYRMILRALKKARLPEIKALFAVRSGVRSLYRRVMGHD